MITEEKANVFLLHIDLFHKKALNTLENILTNSIKMFCIQEIK